MEYLLPENLRREALRKALEDYAPIRSGSVEETQRLFFDSFDWRLYQRGLILEEVWENGSGRMQLRKTGSSRPMTQLAARTPRFAQELPPSVLRQTLAGILEMRCLFPLARIITTSHPLAVLDSNQKTVVRLTLDEHSFGCAQPELTAQRECRLRLLPLRGYAKQTKQFDQYLRSVLKLELVEPDLWRRALAAVQRHPGDYSSKLKLDLDPIQPALDTLHRILQHLFVTMEQNLDGTRRDLDSEFLHDFRVAVRRTRSIFGQFKGVLPPQVHKRFGPEFAWLGSITSRTRDLDVYLLNFDRYCAPLPAEQKKALTVLHNFLLNEQRVAQHALAKELDSKRFRRLFRDWRHWLASPERFPHPEQQTADFPVLAVANRRILKVFERCLNEGAELTEQSPADELHRLRKTCKKLRYLLEFFQSLYPPGKITAMIKALKGLQDNLGAFQDLEVHAQDLCDFSRDMHAQAPVPANTLLAMGMLMGTLRQQQNQSRSEFSVHFAAFASPTNRRLFRKGTP